MEHGSVEEKPPGPLPVLLLALAVCALLVGAVVGGLLSRFARHATPLWVAVAVLVCIAVASLMAARKTSPANR